MLEMLVAAQPGECAKCHTAGGEDGELENRTCIPKEGGL